MSATNKEVIAVVCADLHLSHTPPLARAGEKDWYAAMLRPIDEIKRLANKYKSPDGEYDAPILCAGDIFHHWKSPPELINFALRHLPFMWVIPGQHDLPFHQYNDIGKSAYWTLAESGRLCNLLPNNQRAIRNKIMAYGFPWGFKPDKPQRNYDTSIIKVALVHKYTYYKNACYQGAPKEAELKHHEYDGYDTVVIGDNHIPWEVWLQPSGTFVFNCGSLIRRNSDQLNHKPRVGLLHPDGTITPHYLDISQDVFTLVEEPKRAELEGLSDFVSELQGLKGEDLDFPAAIRRVLATDDISPAVKQILLKAIEE